MSKSSKSRVLYYCPLHLKSFLFIFVNTTWTYNTVYITQNIKSKPYSIKHYYCYYYCYIIIIFKSENTIPKDALCKQIEKQ